MKCTLIVFIEAVACDRLTTASGTRLQITADLVERATGNSAIVTRREAEIVVAIAVANAVILLRVDDELNWFSGRTLFPMPARFL